MTPWLVRPISDADMLGQFSALLLGSALVAWALLSILAALEDES